MKNYQHKCRILFCSTSLSFGGGQKLIGQILNHIDRGYFEPVLCSIRPYGHIDAALYEAGIKIICLQIRSPYNVFKGVRRLLRVIRENKIDVVHMEIFGAEFIGQIAAMLARIPVVVLLTTTYDFKIRAAGSGSGGAPQFIKWLAICLVHAILARLAKIHYIALSEATRRSAIKNLRLPKSKVSVNPLGLDLDAFPAPHLISKEATRIKKQLNLEGAYPVLLNVARLSPMKGQRDLFKAMPSIVKQFPEARLLLAGDGPYLDELERLRESLGMQQHVQLLGRRDDVDVLLAISDIFVFSSYYEGLPGAVIEAMMAGKPVVAFDIPPLQELVCDQATGLLVKSRDIEELAGSVIRLTKNREEARAMGEEARSLARNKYDIKLNLKKLEEIYKVVLLPGC